MNYKQIHDLFVEKCKQTKPKDRLMERNSEDARLKNNCLYVEIHHVIPRSLGGSDIKENLIEVLPEEHIFIHMLRYKIFRKRQDALAVRFMLNGLSFHNHRKKNKTFLSKKIRMGYAWLKTHSHFLRKTEGWHSEEGVKNISEARKGTMPAKDAQTGVMIGSVDVNHPNVISGKWVHHSKGRKQSKKECEDKRERYSGQKNPNASGLTESYFIEKGLEAFEEFGRILSWGQMLKLSKERGFRWIKSLRSRFNHKGLKGYYEIMEQRTQTKFNSYSRKND